MQLRNRTVSTPQAGKPVVVPAEEPRQWLKDLNRPLVNLLLLQLCDNTMAVGVLATHRGQPAVELVLVALSVTAACVWRVSQFDCAQKSVVRWTARAALAVRLASYLGLAIYLAQCMYAGLELSVYELGLAVLTALGVFQIHYLRLPAVMPQLGTVVFYYLLLSSLFDKTAQLSLH